MKETGVQSQFDVFMDIFAFEVRGIGSVSNGRDLG